MVNSLSFLRPYIVSFLSDYGFKVTFGDQHDTLFARKAIELIIGDKHPILSLHYLRNEFAGLAVTARSGIYDVICTDEHKRVFVVEMQVDNYDDLLERLQLYGFQVFTTLPKKGKEGFSNIGVVHCICFIKDAVTPSEKYHQIIHLKNEDNEIVMDNIVFHLIELSKFSITKQELDKIKTEKEELLYTMKYAHKFDPGKDELPPFWQKEIFKRPLKRLNTAKMTPLDAAIYKNMLIRVEAAENIVDKQIRQAVEIATKEAIEQANQAAAQAAAQAAEQAAEQAKAAAEQAKLDSIKKLLLRGKATVEEIAEDFDVSIEFVKDVQMSLNTTK